MGVCRELLAGRNAASTVGDSAGLLCRFYVQSAGNRSLEVSLDAYSITVASTGEKGERSQVEAAAQVKENAWTWIAVTQAKRSMWRSSVSVWVNGSCVKEDRMEYLEVLEGYQLWFAHDRSEMRSSGTEQEFVTERR